MKLLFAIVQYEDEKALTRALVEEAFSVTRVASTGGFLKSGNVTLMVGVDAARLDTALGIIKKRSHKRKAMMAGQPIATQGAEGVPTPMQVNVGGATVFVMDVEQFQKY